MEREVGQNALRSPLTDGIQSLSFPFQVFWVWLIGMIEGSVAIAGLVEVIVQKSG